MTEPKKFNDQKLLFSAVIEECGERCSLMLGLEEIGGGELATIHDNHQMPGSDRASGKERATNHVNRLASHGDTNSALKNQPNTPISPIEFLFSLILVLKKGNDMSVLKLLAEKREAILELAAKYGAYNVRVFGSTVSGKRHAESDVDLLVTLEPDRSLFDLGGLQYELEELLGLKVDLVSDDSLHWSVREQILSEAEEL